MPGLFFSSVSGLLRHRRQRNGPSCHQKQSSHFSLGLCCTAVAASYVRSVSCTRSGNHAPSRTYASLPVFFIISGIPSTYLVTCGLRDDYQPAKFGERIKLEVRNDRFSPFTNPNSVCVARPNFSPHGLTPCRPGRNLCTATRFGIEFSYSS